MLLRLQVAKHATRGQQTRKKGARGVLRDACIEGCAPHYLYKYIIGRLVAGCGVSKKPQPTALAGIAVVRVAWLTISVPRKKVSIALHHAQLY